jgi:hypothetical protein
MQVRAPVNVTSHSIESLRGPVLDLKYDFAFEILFIVTNQIHWRPGDRKLIMVFDKICRLSMKALHAKHL